MAKIMDTQDALAKGERLKRLRKMSGLTIEEFADRYGLGRSTIKFWETGKWMGLSEKGARIVIEAMRLEGIQCSVSWLLNGFGPPPKILDIFCGQIKRKANYKDVVLGEIPCSLDQEVNMFKDSMGNAVTLTLADASMEPFFLSGEIVGGKRVNPEEINKLVGKVCIVETEDNKLLCRKIGEGKDPFRFNLYALNPEDNTLPIVANTRLLSAAPVTRVWQRELK
jgi:transcriptional regulator with XRE-family HTH domain